MIYEDKEYNKIVICDIVRGNVFYTSLNGTLDALNGGHWIMVKSSVIINER